MDYWLWAERAILIAVWLRLLNLSWRQRNRLRCIETTLFSSILLVLFGHALLVLRLLGIVVVRPDNLAHIATLAVIGAGLTLIHLIKEIAST